MRGLLIASVLWTASIFMVGYAFSMLYQCLFTFDLISILTALVVLIPAGAALWLSRHLR